MGILLALGAVAVMALLLKSSGSSGLALKEEGTPPPSPPKKDVKPPQSPVPGLTEGLAVGGGAVAAGASAVVGAGIVISAAAGQLNKALTGDEGGGLLDIATGNMSAFEKGISFAQVGAELNPAIGLSAGVGSQLGKEVDKLVGGSGGGGSGTVAQTVGGLSTAVGSFMGSVAFFSIALTGSIFYAVWVIVEDINRLAFGQKGAEKDYITKWGEQQSKLYNALRDAGCSEADSDRVSWAFADGYMTHMNFLSYAQWMGRGRGFLGLGTTDNGYHAKFGMDRGYFLGNVGITGALLTEPACFSRTAEYFTKAKVNMLGVRKTTRKILVRFEPQFVESPDSYKDQGGFCYIQKSYGRKMLQPLELKDRILADPIGANFDNDITYTRTCGSLSQVGIYEDRDFLEDPIQEAWFEEGKRIANVMAYIEWMTSSYRGLNVPDVTHFMVGIREGRFVGSRTGEGSLRWQDHTYDYLDKETWGTKFNEGYYEKAESIAQANIDAQNILKEEALRLEAARLAAAVYQAPQLPGLNLNIANVGVEAVKTATTAVLTTPTLSTRTRL